MTPLLGIGGSAAAPFPPATAAMAAMARLWLDRSPPPAPAVVAVVAVRAAAARSSGSRRLWLVLRFKWMETKQISQSVGQEKEVDASGAEMVEWEWNGMAIWK